MTIKLGNNILSKSQHETKQKQSVFLDHKGYTGTVPKVGGGRLQRAELSRIEDLLHCPLVLLFRPHIVSLIGSWGGNTNGRVYDQVSLAGCLHSPSLPLPKPQRGTVNV